MQREQIRNKILKNIKRAVIKIGSTVLTNDKGDLDLKIFVSLCEQISRLKEKGVEIAIVSSGAIAAGTKQLGLSERPKSMPQKQAAAAIGQTRLMWNYERFFGEYQQKVAQVLLTHTDLSDRSRFLNARNTLFTLFNYGIIPVINENDSVAVEEIRFGDNDNLSALITNLVEADILIILSDIEGLYDSDPKENKKARLISIVEKIDSRIENLATGTKSTAGVGGMVTKIQATKKVAIFGIPTIIAHGKRAGVIDAIFQGEDVGTLFLPSKEKLTSRKHWIAFTLKPRGTIIVDKGARDAIVQKGKSLLPSGLCSVKGNFSAGDLVKCMDEEGVEFARGLVNYSSTETFQIKGLKTHEVKKRLGSHACDEVIHRDNLVVLRRT
jgi:glutamate 5-kinase